MKKNQIIVVGVLASVLLLFFMLIFRSSGGKDYNGETIIEVRVQSGIVLPKSYSDSLLRLVNLYQGGEGKFTQSMLKIFSTTEEFEEVSCPMSGMNQLRTIFSNNFYTFDERSSDIRTMRENAAQYASFFTKTCPLPTETPTLNVFVESNNPEYSVAYLENYVASNLQGEGKTIKIFFSTNEENGPPTEDDRDGDGVLNDEDKCPDKKGPRQNKGCPENISIGVVPVPITVQVTPNFSFQRGLPNVFSWDEQDGLTYDFSLVCSEGDCSTGLSRNLSNVSGGKVAVEASYAQATEKRYVATLTVFSNGKKIKSYTKAVQLVCAE